MNGTNNQQVFSLLNGSGKPAPELTRGLAALGDGSMADGIIAIWNDGQKNGTVKGAVGASLVFTAAIGIYVLVRNKIAERQAKQIIRAACTNPEQHLNSTHTPNSDNQNTDTTITNTTEAKQ